MHKTRTLALALGACLFTASAQAVTWHVYTTQDLVPAPSTFLSVDACNSAAAGSSGCPGSYAEIGVGTSIDRSLAAEGGWHTEGVADLSLGTVAIAGGGPFPYDRALSSTGFKDLLTFDIPGLLPGGSAEIGIRLVFDGSFVDGSKVGMTFAAGNPFLTDAAYRLNGEAEWNGTFSGGFYTPVATDRFTLAAAPDFTYGYESRWATSGQTVFAGSVRVRGDVPTLPVQLMVYGNGDFDLSSTGRLRLVLPAGASFSSESGVFLAAVPEPQSGLLMALGGLGLASLAWRRARALAAA